MWRSHKTFTLNNFNSNAPIF
uniref:Uncharacterized protein n=1 Tax=Rhizophora mucronata TaxID=61149 RepID=A0A2P2NAD0_RHIMU